MTKETKKELKIFMSWSGNASKLIAEEFKTFIKIFIQHADIWFSVDDIKKGKPWLTQLHKSLEENSIGIFIYTNKNVKSEWMLYEAGAIWKDSEESRLFTYLINIDFNELPSPIQLLQHTKFDKNDTKKLFKEILKISNPNKIEIDDDTFNYKWNKFLNKVNEILKKESNIKEEISQEEKINNITKSLAILNNKIENMEFYDNIMTKAIEIKELVEEKVEEEFEERFEKALKDMAEDEQANIMIEATRLGEI